MRPARRAPRGQAHGTVRLPAALLPRSSDVAVTCWQRLGVPVVAGGPAAQAIGLEPPVGPGVDRPARPALVDVVLGHELVAARAAEIHDVVDRVLQAAPVKLRLRLDAVQRFDAAGLGLLLRVHQQARQRGVELVCTGPPRELTAVLHRTRLDRVLTIGA
jgi:anti-anti-sigma factor